MRQALRFSFLMVAFLFVLQNVSAFVSPASMTSNPKPSPFTNMTVKEFLTLTPKKYQEMTGTKMKLSQKVSLKIAQSKVKKMAKKNPDMNIMPFTQGIDTSDFSIGGFVLGLLLGVIGVLIAYLIGDQQIIKWSWYGFAIWGIIVLLAILL
ncbi:MAG: hypothetical protein ACXWV5_10115 [Flavitalea sp.]